MWTIAAIMIVFVLIIVFVNYMLRRGTWSKQSRQIKRQRKKMLAARFAKNKSVPRQTKIADMRIGKSGTNIGPRSYPQNERTPDPHEDMFNHTAPIMPLFLGVTQAQVTEDTNRDEDISHVEEEFKGFNEGDFGGAGGGDTWEDNTTDNSVDNSCSDSTDWNNE